MSVVTARISAKLEETIRAELPEQLGAELRKLLEEGEKAKQEVIVMNEQYAADKELITKLKEQIRTLSEANAAWTKLDTDLRTRERAVAKIEYDLFEARMRKEVAEEKSKDLKEIVSLVFRSPVFHSTVSEQGNRYDSGTGRSDSFSSSRTIDQTQK